MRLPHVDGVRAAEGLGRPVQRVVVQQAARRRDHEVVALHENASDVFRFTSALNKRFSPEERLEIVELLWEVVYADGEAHHYETNLMRRLAGLLYLEDGDVGAARKRVLARR